jgi:large subunit ribosomal protein L25
MAVALSGAIREGRGKGANRKLRAQGILPAVLYGKKSNVSLTVQPKKLKKIIEQHGINTLIELTIEGDTEAKRLVVVKQHQEHPIKEGWVHADFFEVDVTQKIKVQAPIVLVGHSPGEKLGGIVEHNLHTLNIRCLPNEIPEKLEVQMAEVQLDQVVHVSDLKVPDNIEVLDHPEEAVVSVHEVKVKEAKAEGEEAEGEEAAAAAPAASENKAESKEG